MRVQIKELDLDGARDTLRQLVRSEAGYRAAQGKSNNISQTQLGQLIDEYALEPDALAEMQAIRHLPAARRMGQLRDIAMRYPDATAAAITLLVAMRQDGQFALRTVPQGQQRGIPARICQFWDTLDVPADILAYMESWRDQHQGWEFLRFDDDAAYDFLMRYPEEVRTAYRRARSTAMKSDLFRLAWLYAEGGYYADADDRCIAAIDDWVPADYRLVLWQEEFGSIGNNFIGAAPRHPLIGIALRQAVNAINRGDVDILWLSTGPGLLTRTFARLLPFYAEDWPSFLEDIAVLDRGDYFRMVAPHCHAAYKTTDKHWGNSAFKKTRR